MLPLGAAHLVWQVWVRMWWSATLGPPISCCLGSLQGVSGLDPTPFVHRCRAEPGPLPQTKGAGSSPRRLPPAAFGFQILTFFPSTPVHMVSDGDKSLK